MNLPVNGIDRARMAVEDDSAVLSIDGNSYAVERASYSFINAYRVYTGTGLLAEKEQNRDYFIDEPIGVTRITDMIPSTYFSGNDLVVQLTMGATNYYGWVSRPIKDQGIVRGFYFWYDPQFTTMSTATMDGNQDGDRNPGDNNAFILVVDQSYFDGIAASGTTTINGVARTYKFVGSSSDRVDSAINALIVPNRNPTPANDSLTVLEDGGAGTGNLLTNDSDPDIDALSVTGFRVGGVSGTLGQPFAIAGVGQFTLSADGSYSFTPAADHAGPVPAITYTVSDGNGGSATATLSIAITPVNDAPAGTDRTIPLNEDSAYAFSATDFGFSDPKDSPADGLASVVITTLPALGPSR
ncbi:cadherin-like domain-containing protein [Azospirillum thermophilum]|uniref:RapA2 cadherin-like domain-containing protein n=1 Tax=Azospirillum thermophilum TaxID=2202148 RepID=A0A2S2CYZ4_9PROT|nr:cadherin-like domain-containing protein [Azospirillum thermophilum]AWK89733.1 hypothetical protein DEW08_27525 [Azospirillum thermophilum]